MKKTITQSIPFSVESPSFEYLVPLFYFQIFSHPLTLSELQSFSQQSNWNTTNAKAFFELCVNDGLVYFLDGYYMLENKPNWIKQREENEERAKRFLNKTRKIVQLMRRFPFVEAIFLSGSASKGVVPEDGDVDYFIITKPSRLWLTRTLLVLFKKLVLLNSHRFFCINYLIDTDHLEIEEKNRYTATEIITLLPVYNSSYYQSFLDTNQWTRQYLPNAKNRLPLIDTEMPTSKIKAGLEKILNGKLGQQLDIWAMKLSIQHWKKKFKSMDKKHFDVALKSRSYVSKHHPQDFQTKVTNAFDENIKAFEQKHGVVLYQKLNNDDKK